VELRQYTLRPGKRDALIDLFEAHFVEGQEQAGMSVIGTFRDLDRDDRFVWVRGFADMATRARSLAAFYGGPIWQAHRDAANGTMVESDDVLLLRPARASSGLASTSAPQASHTPANTGRGVVEATILHLAPGAEEQALAYFDERIAARVGTVGSLLGPFVTEHSANNFPALPVREGEEVLVWFAGYRDRAAYEAARRQDGLARAAATTPGLAAAPQILRLAPTRRSRMTGSAIAAGTP
jgi:quinol monooxygenase YgiN